MKLKLSLRTKFTLVLLVSSLLSLFAAGLIARTILLRELGNIVMHESFHHFHTEMTSYIETYGSLKNALERESFEAFEERRRNRLSSPMPRLVPPTGKASANRNSGATKPIPPFRFALSDPDGRILIGSNQLKVGEVAPKQLRELGKPILLKGKTVAMALPSSQPNLDLDFVYLKAMHLALIAAALTGGLLSLFLGLVIGNRLNGRISRLTVAIKAMQVGDLYQRVEESSRDEIGVLANAFNRMSAELTQMHDALHQSNLQIKSQAEQMKELSIRDELTDLYNRRHANEEGARLFAEATQNSWPLTVVMGDIDSFKKINDSISHAMGDEVLRRIANLLQTHSRSGDVLARYGGEEFVLILPQTPLTLGVALCEELRTIIEEHPWKDIHPDLYVTISFGLCDDTDCGSFETQLDIADNNLYKAKLQGRNCIWHDKRE